MDLRQNVKVPVLSNDQQIRGFKRCFAAPLPWS